MKISATGNFPIYGRCMMVHVIWDKRTCRHKLYNYVVPHNDYMTIPHLPHTLLRFSTILFQLSNFVKYSSGLHLLHMVTHICTCISRECTLYYLCVPSLLALSRTASVVAVKWSTMSRPQAEWDTYRARYRIIHVLVLVSCLGYYII